MYTALNNGLGCGGDCHCGCSAGVGDVTDTVSSVVGEWDWHEWVLAGIGAFFVLRFLGGQASRAGRAVTAPLAARSRKRKRLSQATRRYEDEKRRILA